VAEAKIHAAVVTFADAPALAAFAREPELRDLPLFGDPDRRLYAAFGFGRGSVVRVWLDPRAIRRDLVLRARRRGRRRRSGLPGQDTLQLGGDVVIDAAGRVRWVYACRGPDDRPSIASIIDAMLRSG
jgi:hypothetical protein